MKRVMQTAYHLLKDRPDFAQLQFIMSPLCREQLHTTADVPSCYTDAVNAARSMFSIVDVESCFQGYENRENWFVEDLVKVPETR